MPGIRRLLAVNRIRPKYSPAEVRKELDDFPSGDTRSKAVSEHITLRFQTQPRNIPPTPPDMQQGGEPLPLFYELKTEDTKNPPHQIERDRHLTQVARFLDKETPHGGRNQSEVAGTFRCYSAWFPASQTLC